MTEKKIPQRTCVVCRNPNAKGDLIRVVCQKSGFIGVDPTLKAQGRGAYICRDKACLQKAVKTKVFNKVFKTETPASLYEELAKYINE